MRDPGLRHAWRRADSTANRSDEAKLGLDEENGGGLHDRQRAT